MFKKVCIPMLLVVVVIIIPLFIALDFYQTKKAISENSTAFISDNFTSNEKEGIINSSPDKGDVIINKEKTYTYKYEYIKTSGDYFVLGNKIPNIYFRVFSNESEEIPPDEGKIYSLEDFRGKKIILNFWASWCESCLSEFEIFQKYSEKNSDVIVFMVNIDNTDYSSAISLINRKGYDLKIIYDAKELQSKYSLTGIPRTILVDENGIFKKIKIGSFIDENELKFFMEGIK